MNQLEGTQREVTFILPGWYLKQDPVHERLPVTEGIDETQGERTKDILSVRYTCDEDEKKPKLKKNHYVYFSSIKNLFKKIKVPYVVCQH